MSRILPLTSARHHIDWSPPGGSFDWIRIVYEIYGTRHGNRVVLRRFMWEPSDRMFRVTKEFGIIILTLAHTRLRPTSAVITVLGFLYPEVDPGPPSWPVHLRRITSPTHHYPSACPPAHD